MKEAALVLVLLCLSCRTTTTDVHPARTSVPESATAFRPPVPGPANLSFACVAPKNGCEATGYSMAVLGDVAQCQVMGPGALRLELKSSNDTQDGILVAFEGYHGPDTYTLDDPARNFLKVSDAVQVVDCSGPRQVGEVVTAGDPNCPSPACTIRVSDAAPAAPFPKPLTFAVRCTSLCQSGGPMFCQGPFDFIIRVDCG